MEASRKLGRVHEAVITCSNLLFRGVLEGFVPFSASREEVGVRMISSGFCNPGLSLFTIGLEQLIMHNPVTGWSARELLDQLILKLLDSIGSLIEQCLEVYGFMCPQYGFVRFVATFGYCSWKGNVSYL